MPIVEKICQNQGVNRAASILAIGTANPPHCVNQDNYPDYYFGLTNSNHMTELRDTFKRMCSKSTIKKRYMHLTEGMLKENPNLIDHTTPSFNTRQDILVQEVPKLGKNAAEKAVKEWGQPKSKITHLIMCTSSGVDMPGADYEMIKLLDLDSSVCRVMLYYQGCYAGGIVLRLAKDIAENNREARVLVVCSEITTVKAFTKPSSKQMGNLVGQAVFGDGAAALIIGADPDVSIERPIFRIISSTQSIIPQSEGAIRSHLRETGMNIHLQKNVPTLIASNICNALNKAFTTLGISVWNSIFWILHPGGVAIIDQIEATLGLRDGKLAATRNVLREFGNMSSASVLFILDEMRKKSMEQGKETTGEGLDWGVLFGFGPGITVETVVLHSVPLNGWT